MSRPLGVALAVVCLASSVTAQTRGAKPPTPPRPNQRAAQQQTKGPPPARRCQLEFPNRPTSRFQSVKDPATGKYNTFVGGGVVGICVGQQVSVTSDSAELYDPSGTYLLLGNVHYREERVAVDADRAMYYRADERLVADQNVVATTPSGSKMVGSHVEYFRPVMPLRSVAKIVAVNRPTATIIEKDSTGKASEPVTLVANTITVFGDSVYHGSGQVEITRPDLRATGDSAYVDNQREYARLLRKPVIVGKGERAFTLRGKIIDMYSRARRVNRVIALDSANAKSTDMNLVSDTIELRISADRLQRAIAWGRSGAHVVSPDRDIRADSLDILMPDQHIREVHAVRQAYAETVPDSTKIASKQRDWLRGDTIIARFDPIPPGDTTSKPRIRELAASGNARSFYQIASQQGKAGPPSENYVRGKAIQVAFRGQEVHTVTVLEGDGVYLDPSADTTKAKGKPGARRPAKAAPRPAVPLPTVPRRPQSSPDTP
jgi:lipopolysaccharide export system protein LptA